MIADKMATIVGLFEMQSYHQYLGFKVTECANGFSRIKVDIRPELRNLGGTMHGGIIYSLCAIASSLAALSVVDEGKYTVASDFNISVVSAISSGTVTIEGKVIKAGKRLMFVEVKVFDEHDKVTALGRVTKSILA